MGLARARWPSLALLAGLFVLGWPNAARADRRVPVAVMELAARSVDLDAARALGTEVSNTLAELRVFRVITREDIKRMLQLEQTRQQCTGEADAACLAEIGGALGVDYMVYGEIAKVAETFSLSLVLLDIARAEAVSRASAKVDRASGLFDEARRASLRLVQPLLADRTGYLVVDARETGAEVEVDGKLVGVTPLAGKLELPMGPHEVVVEKEGFLVWARSLDVEPGQATVAPVALVPSQSWVSDYQSRAQTLRTAAWGTAGGALLMVGAGVSLALIADARFDDLVGKGWLSRDSSDCPDIGATAGDYCATSSGLSSGVLSEVDGVNTTDTLAVGALVTGGVLGLTSAILFLTGDDPDRYEAFGVLEHIQVGPSQVSFHMEL